MIDPRTPSRSHPARMASAGAALLALTALIAAAGPMAAQAPELGDPELQVLPISTQLWVGDDDLIHPLLDQVGRGHPPHQPGPAQQDNPHRSVSLVAR